MEEVERRRNTRGILRGLEIIFPDGVVLSVGDGSRKGFFVEAEDPDRFRLGEVVEVGLRRGDTGFECRVEVVRKDIHPRRGIVFRIVYITPVAEETLKALLEVM